MFKICGSNFALGRDAPRGCPFRLQFSLSILDTHKGHPYDNPIFKN